MNRSKKLKNEIINNNVGDEYLNLPESIKLRVDELRQNYKEIFLYFFIIVLIYSTYKEIICLVEDSFFVSITSIFSTKVVNDFLFGGVFLSILLYFIIVKLYISDLVPSLTSIIRSCILVCLYFYLFKWSLSFIDHYHFTISNQIHYLDLVWISVALLTLRCKPYKKLEILKPEYTLIEDFFDVEKDSDQLSRRPYAEHIAEHIKNTRNQKAFAIAVIGNWGAGKTTFMNFIETHLHSSDSNENVIINYNPWKVTKTKVMIDDFFKSFISVVNDIDGDLSNKLKIYSNYLTDLNDGTLSKMALLTNNIFYRPHTPDTVLDAYDQINKQINKLGKRFVVFVDDIDRLTGYEILQIIKIIRNTANFNNVFFVVGVDYSYAIKSIKRTKTISNEETYLQKIFQLEVILPPFDISTILPKLKESIQYSQLLPDEKQRFDLVFQGISFVNPSGYHLLFGSGEREGIIEHNLNSFRDIVRFSNSFKISYRILNEHVDLLDLILLEIIKIKYPEVYMKIANRDILKYSDTFQDEGVSRYEIDEEKMDKKSMTPGLQKLMDSLYGVSLKELKSFRSVMYPSNHFLYFNFFLFASSSISIKEFDLVRKLSSNEMIEKLMTWNERDSTRGVLNKILSELNAYENIDEFKKFTKAKLVLSSDKNSWIENVHQLLRDEETMVKEYKFTDRTDIEAFLATLFSDNDISPITRGNLVGAFLRDILYNKENPYFSKDVLNGFALGLFKKYAESHGRMDYSVMGMYYNNIDVIDPVTSAIILTQQANESLRKIINQHQTDYLTLLLRPAYSPPKDEYTFEPFLRQTFKTSNADDGHENFMKFLNEYTEDLELKNSF